MDQDVRWEAASKSADTAALVAGGVGRSSGVIATDSDAAGASDSASAATASEAAAILSLLAAACRPLPCMLGANARSTGGVSADTGVNPPGELGYVFELGVQGCATMSLFVGE